MGILARAATAALMLCGVVVTGAAVASADSPVIPTIAGPPQTVHGSASLYSKDHPGSTPAGSNDFGCRPSPGTNPVILAHGSDSTAYSDYAMLGPQLKAAGLCVFALNYGQVAGRNSYGVGDIYRSSGQLAEFVDHVRASTGAAKVDLVGYSQGANVTRYYVNQMGGYNVVDQWVGIASPSHGGVFYGLAPMVESTPGALSLLKDVVTIALQQQIEGSRYMQDLNRNGETRPGTRYLTISSRLDETVQPFESFALHGPGATNLVIQDMCPVNMTGHFHMPYDPFAMQLVVNALVPGTPAPQCVAVAPGTGIPETIGASIAGR